MGQTKRQGFVLYHDIRRPIALLSDEQRGRLFLALLDYSELGKEPDFGDSAVDLAFAFIRQTLDSSAEKWEETRAKRAAAGSIGGRRKAENLANATLAKQNVANDSKPSKRSKLELEHELEHEHELEPKKKKSAAKPRFVPPTLEEVRAYCTERNSPVDPEQFYSYFTADPDRQWVDAKGNHVTSWKQKLLTWEKYDAGRSKPKTGGQVQPSGDYRSTGMGDLLSMMRGAKT